MELILTFSVSWRLRNGDSPEGLSRADLKSGFCKPGQNIPAICHFPLEVTATYRIWTPKDKSHFKDWCRLWRHHNKIWRMVLFSKSKDPGRCGSVLSPECFTPKRFFTYFQSVEENTVVGYDSGMCIYITGIAGQSSEPSAALKMTVTESVSWGKTGTVVTTWALEENVRFEQHQKRKGNR